VVDGDGESSPEKNPEDSKTRLMPRRRRLHCHSYMTRRFHLQEESKVSLTPNQGETTGLEGVKGKARVRTSF